MNIPIEPHSDKVIAWSQTHRSGNREDRTLSEITVQLPPRISTFVPVLPTPTASLVDDALTAITRLDVTAGHHLAALSVLLLRAESVASSKIERIDASMDDYARAAHGVRSNASATSMVAATEALDALISSLGGQHDLTLDNILQAHHRLMVDDHYEAAYGGKLRDVQNWIGGSDHSPRNSLYTPPPPEMVPDYMDDLLRFANRDDIPTLIQAAVAHAQFESIHPFTDGNGRIGRALINAILRRRGVTTTIVVPIATALVARRSTYFGVLTAYRQGDLGPMIRALVLAAQIAAVESEATAGRLRELPDLWQQLYSDRYGRAPRAGSAGYKILDQLPSTTFFGTDMVELVGGATSAVYGAIDKLHQAGILRPLTNRTRNQIWCVSAVVDELDDLSNRVGARTLQDERWNQLGV